MNDPTGPAVELPEGNYFFALEGIPENFGGLTKACLARAGAFAHQADRAVTILLLRARADYHVERRDLERRGLLEAPNRLRYLHEDLADWDHRAEPGEVPTDPPGLTPTLLERSVPSPSGVREKVRARWREFRKQGPDLAAGEVWRVDWHTTDGDLRVQDHHRDDGTLYLRREIHQKDGKDLTTTLTLHDRQERERDRYPSVPSLSREWVSRLIGDERAFLVVDGQAVGQHLRKVRNKKRFVFQVMHGTHIRPPIRIDGPIRPLRAHMVRDLAEWDGLVLLTESQRRDLALRDGDRSNLVVIGNQSRPLPEWPDPDLRTPRTALVVSRLVGGKRVGHTIRAFRQVVDRVPDAQLVIFGDGEERTKLEKIVTKLGLESSVTFRGHDPKAADAFRTATLSVLSSAWEGQPLAVLESLSAGCPVVAFDITYGPADMITDGVEGRLVPDDDTDALAAAIGDVLSDEELARTMSRAAWERSFDFDEEHLVQRWAGTFEASLAQRAHRVKLGRVGWADLTRSADGGTHRVAATVRAAATVPKAATGEYRISWVQVDRATGTHHVTPADAAPTEGTPDDGEFAWRVTGEWPSDPFDPNRTLHLDLVWNNTHWRSDPLPPAP